MEPLEFDPEIERTARRNRREVRDARREQYQVIFENQVFEETVEMDPALPDP